MNTPNRKGNEIIGSFIDAISWNESIIKITDWALKQESRYICICNVHSLVTAKHNHQFINVINNADMATPDGFPVAWMLRRLGHKKQDRINGPDLMWKLCEHAQKSALRIFLYGSTDKTLEKLKEQLTKHFPKLHIVGLFAPPFRKLSDSEERENINLINTSDAQIVFVGLGCPKQEFWMSNHKEDIHAVMIGVGAAFDYHAGTLKRAPLWMQRNGLEWLYRLIKEPARLWKRYLVTNTIFAYYALLSLYSHTTKS